MAARCLASALVRRRPWMMPIATSSAITNPMRSFSSGADEEFQVAPEILRDPAIGDAFHLDTSNLWTIFRGPVSLVATFLDSVHVATGAPWWIVLAGSTIAVRAALFPVTVIQLRKTAQLAQLSGKLPSPVPPPGSGVTQLEQFKLYSQKRKELGVPSPAWCFASLFVQVPIFISWTLAIRNMAINKYPGFETGGALWFTDLTVPVSGDLGALLPISLSVAYICHIEVSLKGIEPKPGIVGSLLSFYGWWLRFCVIPVCISGFYFPQGVFMYWLPNTLFSLAQTLCLRSSYFRKRLGLPVMVAPKASADPRASQSETLIKLAAEHVVRKNRDAAVQCLKAALKKDPENATAYFALGKLHTDASEWAEATDLLAQAASKAKDNKLQISAYLALGIALYKQVGVFHRWLPNSLYCLQGKIGEATAALKCVASMEEPQDGASRKKYNVALVTLGSLLSQDGQKFAALEYLERAARYDPKVGDLYVEQIKKELAQAKEVEEVEEADVQTGDSHVR
ncbi:ALBINO3-like protein 3, mitochondrial isoform X1 [Selaginella moellendorffii]|uniref:ALBINO3-like protein 3, mitochondrial isoform X1 n=1 Tax=Selaginella moellendorffii TaxID=88036 RepID=UPI000D1C2C07|nr:ALBINO3-like protein 3, mitochondrial isoform X1 [Selaginella moellendorffii]|eukprot:XP_024527640.1 ALBINO3-like protein 3, mitochondrial isoform X1 [Selaginella moellendorffii]